MHNETLFQEIQARLPGFKLEHDVPKREADLGIIYLDENISLLGLKYYPDVYSIELLEHPYEYKAEVKDREKAIDIFCKVALQKTTREQCLMFLLCYYEPPYPNYTTLLSAVAPERIRTATRYKHDKRIVDMFRNFSKEKPLSQTCWRIVHLLEILLKDFEKTQAKQL